MINYTTPNLPLAWLLNNNQQVKAGTNYSVIGSNPKMFSATENIVNYIFNNTTTGVTPVNTRLVLTVVGLPSTTTGSITLKNSFQTIKLTASNTPSVNQWFNNGTGVTALARSVRAESIAYELRSNLIFNQYYNVWSQGAVIFIEARVAGTAYNFDTALLSSELILLGGMTASNTNGTNTYNWQNLIDYNAFVEVYVAEGIYGDIINKNNSILADQLNITPYDNPNFAINISDSIKPYVDIVLPTKRTSPVIVVKELDKQIDSFGNPLLPVVRPFYIVWGYEQRFGLGLEKKKSITGVSDIRFALNGAFGLLEDYNFSPYILDTTLTSSFKLMTSCPKVKDTNYDSQEYIHFYRKSNAIELGTFGLEVVYTFTDLTQATVSYTLGSYAGIDGTLSIDVSPNVLRLLNVEAVNGKLIDSYEVKVYWTTNSTLRYYSESRIYNVKRICNPSTNNVIFVNEFGVFETLNFTGEVIKSVNRDVEYLQRPIGINTPNTGFNSISDEITIPVNMNVVDRFTITSDLISKAQYSWLSRMLASSSVFIYDQQGSRYRAINVQDFNYESNSLNETSSFSMTYSFTVNNNYITR
jgi:hypothetical protein